MSVNLGKVTDYTGHKCDSPLAEAAFTMLKEGFHADDCGDVEGPHGFHFVAYVSENMINGQLRYADEEYLPGMPTTPTPVWARITGQGFIHVMAHGPNAHARYHAWVDGAGDLS